MNETVEIPFEGSDPDATPLEVQCLGSDCRIENGRAVVGPISNAGTYFYTLHVKDTGGKLAYAHFVVDVAAGAVASERPSASGGFALDAPFPNPFRTCTTFTVNVDQAGLVVVDVYDLHGRRVAKIDEGWYAAGRHELIWDAPDLSSGTYVMHLTGEHASDSRLVTLIK